MKRVVIIGAGPVGCTAALVLDRLGYRVTLIEKHCDILLGGAAAAANVNHSDGFEYYKPGHIETGEYCVDGAIVKAILFPSRSFDSKTCSVGQPARFLVSKESNGKEGLNYHSFSRNAGHMSRRFQKHFMRLQRALKLDSTSLEQLFGRNPKTFARELSAEEIGDCANIAYGYAGSGSGIDMATYYAFLKSCLNDSSVDLRLNETISSIEPGHASGYQINTQTFSIYCDCVLLACAHGITDMIQIISQGDASRIPSIPGTYFLNAMTYIRLPASGSTSLVASASRINFTLQGEGGAMYACIVPPSIDSDGYGAVYYPSPKGSQLQRYLYYSNEPVTLQRQWQGVIDAGIPIESPRVGAIINQAEHYYPFLKNYAVVDKTICRTVFNPSTVDSNLGLERRVREVIEADVITSDRKIAAFRSPKWTNAELVGLIAADYAIGILSGRTLPKDPKYGFGPTFLDLTKIESLVSLREVKVDLKYREIYQKAWEFPAELFSESTVPAADSTQENPH